MPCCHSDGLLWKLKDMCRKVSYTCHKSVGSMFLDVLAILTSKGVQLAFYFLIFSGQLSTVSSLYNNNQKANTYINACMYLTTAQL